MEHPVFLWIIRARFCASSESSLKSLSFQFECSRQGINMKKFILLLASLLFIDLVYSDGNVGDFDKSSMLSEQKLTADQIQMYYTNDKVVGRDMEPDQCSSNVLEKRLPFQESVSKSTNYSSALWSELYGKYLFLICINVPPRE